ncbi:MAG TPA: NAD(P)/FAD-dependent oxidoreductase, partial [Jatrophihabitans sp.]|nr:NAD(P)/FAD-dependent oxidoreductase [Jatrophihabitans sp.]
MTGASTIGLPDQVEVFIVGAGFAGLGAAIKLAEAGEQDFLCIDRGSEIGGTWRDNHYPGAACDVPSQLYSFSFAPNPDWSHSFSRQPEIQQYLRTLADRSGLLDRFRFNVALTSAAWDAGAERWRIETTAGVTSARLLVAATGALSEPRLPEIEGIETFAGEIFHSAQWNHDFDLTGKAVAVIGTGASAIQIVPELAGRAGRVVVFQRTAPWVLPRRDVAYRPWQLQLLRRVPPLQRLARAGIYLAREATVPMFIARPGLGKLAARQARRNIDRAISDPELRARVSPHYALGCKRVLISNDWYPALTRDDVTLVTEPIRRLTPSGVLTSDGIEHRVDALVVATGFQATEPPIARLVSGVGGRTLGDAWAEHGIQAYKGTAVAGFPNLFFLIGPNTGLGHSSMIYMIESQLAYLVDAWRTMRRHRLSAVEVLPEVQRSWNADLQRRMRRTVWQTGC